MPNFTEIWDLYLLSYLSHHSIRRNRYGVIFWLLSFWEFYIPRRKPIIGISGVLRKLWVRNMRFLCKNIDLKVWPCLTWPLSKGTFDDAIVKLPSLAISTCKMIPKICVARHNCDFYFKWPFVAWPWPLEVWPSYSCSTSPRHKTTLWVSLSFLRPV